MQSVIKYIMPNLHSSSILKAVHRTLDGYDGPKKSTRLKNGGQIDVCCHSGCATTSLKKRAVPSGARSLARRSNRPCASVWENVHPSSQTQQPQPREQQAEESIQSSRLKRKLLSCRKLYGPSTSMALSRSTNLRAKLALLM